jgi:hypothetical protein
MLYQSLLIKSVFRADDTEKIDIQTPGRNNKDEALHVQNAVNVYYNNYLENGIRALSISYATVFGILDVADFRKLASAYILAHPKTCFDWADYGEKLSEFMFDVDALAEMPFLPELAELDWRLMHAERAADKRFDPDSFALLQTHPLTSLYFALAPGSQIMQTIFPVAEIYQLVHETSGSNDNATIDENQDTLISSEVNVNNLIKSAINNPVYRSVVIWREEYKALFEYCDSTSTKAFKSMLQNANISDVLSHFGDDQSAITQWLQSHIQSRKIYAVIKQTEKNEDDY